MSKKRKKFLSRETSLINRITFYHTVVLYSQYKYSNDKFSNLLVIPETTSYFQLAFSKITCFKVETTLLHTVYYSNSCIVIGLQHMLYFKRQPLETNLLHDSINRTIYSILYKHTYFLNDARITKTFPLVFR